MAVSDNVDPIPVASRNFIVSLNVSLLLREWVSLLPLSFVSLLSKIFYFGVPLRNSLSGYTRT
jgi:hypothetical protein